eukprot:Skav210592  [mRNA]  locus=scaffold3272:308056:308897:- [translate_table: standard]
MEFHPADRLIGIDGRSTILQASQRQLRHRLRCHCCKRPRHSRETPLIPLHDALRKFAKLHGNLVEQEMLQQHLVSPNKTLPFGYRPKSTRTLRPETQSLPSHSTCAWSPRIRNGLGSLYGVCDVPIHLPHAQDLLDYTC